MPAMLANVVKSTQIPVAITHDKDILIADGRGQIVTTVLQLTDVAGVPPVAIENCFQFFLKDAVVEVKTRWQSERPCWIFAEWCVVYSAFQNVGMH